MQLLEHKHENMILYIKNVKDKMGMSAFPIIFLFASNPDIS